MTRPEPSRRVIVGSAVAGLLAALVPALAMWGFTVDDALIPARYAAHIASGAGYRFNAAGPVTDGVTPLGWAYLLAPFAGSGPLAALHAAKVIGIAAWALASAALGVAIARSSEEPIRFAALALVAASAPLAAWSAAGLETGVVAALATFAVVLRQSGRDRVGASFLGLAAAMRPELAPFALVVAAAPGPRDARAPAPCWLRVALVVTPFVVVAAIRGVAFGRLAPLSILAKPPDTGLGVSYALACFLLTGPVALVAPFAWRRLDGFARGLVAAVGAHFVAIALAGGDWMPLSRLTVAVLPASALAAAHVLAATHAWVGPLRLALALSGEVFAWARAGTVAMDVMPDRLALIDELGPHLRDAAVVATLDIGWVGAATGATVVDLAGVTDPAIAALPGGHTTRQIPASLLDARGVDTLVMLLQEGESVAEPWTASHFARGVEAWVASTPNVGDELEVVTVSRRSSLHYVVLRRRHLLSGLDARRP